MNEKELELKIVDILKSQNKEQLSTVKVEGKDVNLEELLNGHDYEIIEDNSIWRTREDKFPDDIIGGMTPDIVIRDRNTGKVRIIIEVKNKYQDLCSCLQ